MRQVKVIRLKYMVPDQALTFLDTLKSDIGKILLDAESGTLMVMDTPEKINDVLSWLILFSASITASLSCWFSCKVFCNKSSNWYLEPPFAWPKEK